MKDFEDSARASLSLSTLRVSYFQLLILSQIILKTLLMVKLWKRRRKVNLI